ncbi:PfaD family polyunsaturated fatty acid/polyketide biosynthesis protein [Pseudoduganella sp. LjRoot289]|uniref:PfaD family polyunsaturated fatty acid/polyketide biosynthesis protein n=1 Tax=Pseudoduganella sp. LjRoot289 TaxID=3342314 RepID=UPI003ECC51BE
MPSARSTTLFTPPQGESSGIPALGSWQAGSEAAAYAEREIENAVQRIREPVHVVRAAPDQRLGLALGGSFSSATAHGTAHELIATLPALYPEWLGERGFCERHALRFPYLAGEMANGISTVRMVIAMARAEMMGFFGAGGLGFGDVEQAVATLQAELGGHGNWGVNLIHSPSEPELEERVAAMLIERGVPRISASAFMGLTPAVVRCAVAGLRRDGAGRVVRRTHLFAKVSRPEVAQKFMAPAPADILQLLLARGQITAAEAVLAAEVPVADNITVESDSGGHTDNRPLGPLLPAILALRDSMVAQHRYTQPIFVGAAGGLGTPNSVASAFALGAAYVVTGTVNQVALESGLSEEGKQLLAEADLADVMMAPAADMFELGVKLQVLRRGTMFGVRAARLYSAYVEHASLEAIAPALRSQLEKNVLQASFDEVWDITRAFWARRDPAELARAEQDPKHRMALVFRWYLGMSSRWAITGEKSRRTDYQIWCGPAMGAFNRWTRGSLLAQPAQRSVVQIALNLLEGAAVVTRAQQLRTYGVAIPAGGFSFSPRALS